MDGEPTMNWTIDVKFCLRWNWRQSTFSSEKRWIFCPPPWLDTSGGIMVNTARCASTQAKVAVIKLSHKVLKYSKLQYIHLIYLPLFYFPDQIPSCITWNCPCFLIQGTCCCSSWRHLWVRVSEKRCPLSSSGRSINHLKAECKELYAYIYIHYIPMIYLRYQVCKKQTLKHSWSLCFQTIFFIQVVTTTTTITTTRTPTTTTATTTLTLNSRLVRMTLKQELWGDGLKRCMWNASAAVSILQVYVHQRRSLATMEVHCAY